MEKLIIIPSFSKISFNFIIQPGVVTLWDSQIQF